MVKIASISDFGQLFTNIVGDVVGLAGIVLFVMLLMGGVKYATAGGDPKAVDAAQKTLTYSIIGLVVILVSFLILLLIKQITGVDVTKFNVVLQ